MLRKFELTILGCSAATPTSLRQTSAQIVAYHNKFFLLDCGEGTQIQLRRLKFSILKIDHIFISHLHGDHYLGLPGLLFTMHLLGRKRELKVYAPPGMREIIEVQFNLSQLMPGYPLEFIEIIEGCQKLYEDKYLTIESIAMKHRIPTFGFLLKEKPQSRNMRKESLIEYNIPREQIAAIKTGADFENPGGTPVPNHEITTPAPSPRAYAFGSDTAYTEDFLEQIRGADLLYHEATFLNDKATIAADKLHSTTTQAAQVALKAGVKRLLLGHYSARYSDLDEFLKEARQVFPDTFLAEEGNIFRVGEE
ncbi:MAG TPA: ribonuclease Z [Bacteroidales bacterium]|nr:ribonuclease Z [Bacteroidales bacterium]